MFTTIIYFVISPEAVNDDEDCWHGMCVCMGFLSLKKVKSQRDYGIMERTISFNENHHKFRSNAPNPTTTAACHPHSRSQVCVVKR
jgi:hypothetical protein